MLCLSLVVMRCQPLRRALCVLESSMDLSRYVDEMKGIAEEIVDDICDSERDFLEVELKRLGIDAWIDFKRSQMELIQSYVSATPSQRKKQKRFQSGYRVYIALGAYQECMSAALMFEQISKNHTLNGTSYRTFAGLACQVFAATTESPNDYLWPWCDSPFDSEIYA
ncbi:hypothetical protein FLL62_15200 [Vibrio cholerae]|nr:hypothetical protein FLL62_15200 [Vibrio cholerae]